MDDGGMWKEWSGQIEKARSAPKRGEVKVVSKYTCAVVGTFVASILILLSIRPPFVLKYEQEKAVCLCGKKVIFWSAIPTLLVALVPEINKLEVSKTS